jgi:hypothetical protein
MVEVLKMSYSPIRGHSPTTDILDPSYRTKREKTRRRLPETR